MAKAQPEAPPLAYSIQGAAYMIGRSKSRVYRALRDGEMSGVKCGSKTLIKREELQRWISNLPVWTDETKSKTSQNLGRFA